MCVYNENASVIFDCVVQYALSSMSTGICFLLIEESRRADITRTLMIHARDSGDISVHNSLIFNHLLGQTRGAGSVELCTSSERKWASLFSTMAL